ncbi:hypothetical protein [Pontibacter flavimaris]|nr:hypothetical protein [Pontibacter flavimaris]
MPLAAAAQAASIGAVDLYFVLYLILWLQLVYTLVVTVGSIAEP